MPQRCSVASTLHMYGTCRTLFSGIQRKQTSFRCYVRMSLRPAHMYVVSLFGMGTKVQTDVVRETAEATVEYQLRLERLQWFAHLQRISTYRTTAFRSRCRSVDSRKAEGDGRFKHGNHSCTDRDCHCGVTLFLNLVNVPKIYKKMHGGV